MADGLDKLEQALRGCAEAVTTTAARGIAARGIQFFRAGFRTGLDVNGKAWIPPKDGHRPPMVRTRTLMNSYKSWFNRTGRGIAITWANDARHAEPLRDGTPKMKPRPHMPQPNAPLPQEMLLDVQTECEKAMEGYWRRVRL